MMTDRFPRGQAAIVAAATHGMGKAPGFSSLDLAAMAGAKALAQVGLAPKDVDGLFVALPDDFMSGLGLAEYYGISPRITENNRTGGSAFMTHAMWAALALATGQCSVALIAYGSNQRSAAGSLIKSMRESPYETPYRLPRPVGAYALAASRYCHEYGLRREQLGEVALAARGWARLNPDAYAREPLTMDDYLASRMVADPLSVRDCCLVTDGAAAIVMVSAERARDLARQPVYLLGAAAATEHREITQMPDLTRTAARLSGPRALAQAGVGVADIDVVQLYDAFTINTLLFLEDLGFCDKGEAGSFVEGGRIAPGGELPVNTNGGGLSCVHPGMYGLFAIVEAVEQLMGRAGQRQVAGARLALAHGNGGELSSQATVVLGMQDVL
ncbi:MULTISPECIES: thiolase [Achromobacter]|jgi:acetyl-CoA acetyltransferase|uniref:Thiolase, C-terminal domain protein 11 n=2 Tax=Achromobacter TaxID=222 RepID=E3HY31_ACHXA|nr:MULTISPECIES: thiolase [Achromobacter]ADP19985.1 thiolase, C-terminal domain protein 11 [Achromobacter xylosoxidans A8]AVG44036.1 thiolase [Achromobacter insolitus]CAB3882629.1 3-ketoacyl-CoA thiolase [Achromobacter aegrifaciens]CAB3910899.1 3-ketoacyl-CoA thiolase [Achromobacter mucicolens]